MATATTSPITIPESHKDLLERPVVGVLVTVSEEGKPLATPVWRRYDGQVIHVVVTAPNGQKARNIRANPHVSMLMLDPENVYRYLEVGRVVEKSSEEGAVEELDRLTRFYLNKPHYYGEIEPAEAQVKSPPVRYEIRLTRVSKFG